MKEQIVRYLNDPVELERLYQQHKMLFKQAFFALYPEVAGHPVAQCWHARLSQEREEWFRLPKKELQFTLWLSLIAGAIANLPEWMAVKSDEFYMRYAGFIVFPFFMIYFVWKNKLSFNQWIGILLFVCASVVYMSFLPDGKHDTFMLASMHLPVVLWLMTGYLFIGGHIHDDQKKMAFLRYNGDLIIVTQLVLISGGIFSFITIGLFQFIQIHIQDVYIHIAIWGITAAPLLANYLIQANPDLVNKVSPIIARIFTPLVAVMLIIYLTTLLFTGKNPYNDREFLILFHLVLIGVMAIIFFSVAATSASIDRLFIYVLLILSMVTIVLCAITLSAILFRIFKWGITPNRLAASGSNILIMTNLIWISFRLFQAGKQKHDMQAVGQSIVSFLPAYMLWAAIVSFLFPVLFHFQ